MKEIGVSRRFLTDDEKEARKLIIEWSQQHYYDHEHKATPKVEIVEIHYDDDEFEWDVELDVEGWIDNPSVSFWIDEDKEVVITAGPDY